MAIKYGNFTIGDKVRSLIKLSAVDLFEEGIVAEFQDNHKWPIGVHMGPHKILTYYNADELTHV